MCQTHSDKPLTCPAKSKRRDTGAGYDTLADNLSSFRSVGNQPIPVEINRLDDGDGIANTLALNHATWHASCRLNCSASRFARIDQTSAATSDASGDILIQGDKVLAKIALQKSINASFVTRLEQTLHLYTRQ